MSATTATITLTELCAPDITGKTIGAYLQVSFTNVGIYQGGGIPVGLINYADQKTIDFTGFLMADVRGEEQVMIGSPSSTHLYNYRYVPATDTLQIFDGQTGVELPASSLPQQLLNDTIIMHAVWNRL